MPEDSVIPMMSFYKSRQRLYINALKPENIVIDDIAHNLSILPRFAGNTARPYSVAEHSLLVMQMVEQMLANEGKRDPKIMLQALLHDACEYITGDIPAPVKALIPQIREFEYGVIWPVVCETFGMDTVVDPMIKKADWVALLVEAYSLQCSDELPNWEEYEHYWPAAATWMEMCGELSCTTMPHPATIENVFLDCFHSLFEACEFGVTDIGLSDEMDENDFVDEVAANE